jgi:hypothetical protein
VGLVSCDDVRAMQTRIKQYRDGLQASAGKLPSDKALDYHGGERSVQAWADLVERCVRFEAESCHVGLFAGSQYDRGRELVTELDAWRDHLSSVDAPDLPAPVPVPKSDVSLLGGVGWGLAAVIAILVLREIR